MECPYCEEELCQHDSYFSGRPGSFYGTSGNGIYYPPTPNYRKLGDIFKCHNEECEAYQEHFYTDLQENLHEGYPC